MFSSLRRQHCGGLKGRSEVDWDLWRWGERMDFLPAVRDFGGRVADFKANSQS